jgi:hypothetical protein
MLAANEMAPETPPVPSAGGSLSNSIVVRGASFGQGSGKATGVFAMGAVSGAALARSNSSSGIGIAASPSPPADRNLLVSSSKALSGAVTRQEVDRRNAATSERRRAISAS